MYLIHPDSARNSDWLFCTGTEELVLLHLLPTCSVLLPSLGLAIPGWQNGDSTIAAPKCIMWVGAGGVLWDGRCENGTSGEARSLPSPCWHSGTGRCHWGGWHSPGHLSLSIPEDQECDANLSGFHLLQCSLSQVPSLIKVQATSALSGGSGLLLGSESLAFPNHPYMDSPLSCRKCHFSPPLPY